MQSSQIGPAQNSGIVFREPNYTEQPGPKEINQKQEHTKKGHGAQNDNRRLNDFISSRPCDLFQLRFYRNQEVRKFRDVHHAKRDPAHSDPNTQRDTHLNRLRVDSQRTVGERDAPKRSHYGYREEGKLPHHPALTRFVDPKSKQLRQQ
jgi:hypothetical protein